MSYFDSYNDNYGFTLPFYFGSASGDDNYPFMVPNMYNLDTVIITGGSDSTEKPGINIITKPLGPLDAASSGYAVSFSVLLIIFIGTGMISSFLGYVDSAMHWKRNRHFHHFLHIFAANFCLLLSLTFAVASRFAGQWSFGDAWFKMLATAISASQTVCAFQLVYLVLTCCQQEFRGEKTKTNGWNKIICYVLWLIALASAWPCAVYESILSDVITGNTVYGGRTMGADLFIRVNTALGFIFPSLVSLGCIIVVFVQKAEKPGDKAKKLPLGGLREVKEAALLFVLFFGCWLPYRAWRVRTLSFISIPACGVPPDIFLYIGVAFSILMPITHCALGKTKPGKEPEVSVSGEVKSGSDGNGNEGTSQK